MNNSSNAYGRRQPNETMRWIIFGVLAMMVFMFFSIRDQRAREAAEKARLEAEAEQALLEASQPEVQTERIVDPVTGETREVVRDENGAEIELPKPVDYVAEWTNQEQYTVRTGSVMVTFGSFGGRAESWKIIDPRYSVALRGQEIDGLSDEEVAAGGEELITEFPNVDGVPIRPFELTLVGAGLSYHELNKVHWDYAAERKEDGSVVATLTSPLVRDLIVTKTFTFPHEGFDVDLEVTVENKGDQTIRFLHEQHGLGMNLGPAVGPWVEDRSYFQILNAIYYDSGIHTLDPGLEESKVSGGQAGFQFIALQDQYFMQALLNVPTTPAIDAARVRIPQQYRPDSGKLARGATRGYVAEAFTAPFSMRPGETTKFAYRVFIGPKARKILAQVGGQQHLQRAVFYQSWWWFRAICLGFMALLDILHGLVGNWGLAILALTITVKLATHPINHWALRQNARFQRQMAKMKPEMDAINEEYKEDPQKKYAAMRKLYADHGTSMTAPLKGCAPMLLQLPIFIALYRIFADYIVLRGATFLWIDDLSGPDLFLENVIGSFDLNLLPLMMLVTQVGTMLVSSKVTDPNQKIMFIVMPFVMLIFFYNMPSGLVLYWTMQNVWQMGHTILTNREVEHEEEDAELAAVAAGGRGGSRRSMTVDVEGGDDGGGSPTDHALAASRKRAGGGAANRLDGPLKSGAAKKRRKGKN